MRLFRRCFGVPERESRGHKFIVVALPGDSDASNQEKLSIDTWRCFRGNRAGGCVDEDDHEMTFPPLVREGDTKNWNHKQNNEIAKKSPTKQNSRHHNQNQDEDGPQKATEQKRKSECSSVDLPQKYPVPKKVLKRNELKEERIYLSMYAILFLIGVLTNIAIVCMLKFDLVPRSQLFLHFIHNAETFLTTTVLLKCLMAPFYIASNSIMKNKSTTTNGDLSDGDFETRSATTADTETLSSDDNSLTTEASILTLDGKEMMIHDVDTNLEKCLEQLPDTSTWKYGSLFIQPAGGTSCPGIDVNESVPIGVPVDFESNLFKGKILFRFKNGKTEDENSHATYFCTSEIQVQRQVVIQGQFKRKLKISEVFMGDIFDKKWKLSPHLGRMVNGIFTRLVPGIIIDVVGEKPKILAPIGAGSHEMSIDKPGHEPDMASPNIPENTFLSNDLKSSELRKVVLGNPNEASQFEYDPELVYTFHTIDEVLDVANYQLHLPLMKIDIDKALGDQPLSIRAVTKPDCSQCESIFYFRCWHERTVAKLQCTN